jgi:tetratricopeptide (TPR) repeat protein
MLRHSLEVPDHSAWHALPDYSNDVGQRLIQAYAVLARQGSAAAEFVRAARLVTPCLARHMADAQRLRIYYVLALGLDAANEPSECLEWLDEALEVAVRLDDFSAISKIYMLRASACKLLFRYRDVADHYRTSRALLWMHAVDLGEPADPLAMVHLLAHEASARFHLGDFSETERLLDEASHLVPPGAAHTLEASTVDWLQALLYRWRERPQEAWYPALHAAQAYMRAGRSPSAVRIQTVVADIALDLARDAGGGTKRDTMLEAAASHLGRALEMAEAIGDERGQVLTRLIDARASRMRHDNRSRVGLIEVLAREGRHFHDDALQAQAFTALGDELVAQGEQESGLGCYREVFGLLDGSEAPVLAIWARRAYHRTREWQA